MATQRKLYRNILIGIITLVFAFVIVSFLNKETKPIKIGFIGNLTGKLSDWGISGRDGFLLGIEDVNAKGGINGHRIEVLIRDDKNDPKLAAQAVEELTQLGVVAIIGPTTSGTAVEAVSVANEKKMLLISTTATTTTLNGLDDFFFRVVSPADHLSIGLAEYLFEKEGWRKVSATFSTKNRIYYENAFGAFKKRFETLGGVVELGPLVTSDRDYKKIAQKVVESSSDGVYIGAPAIQVAAISQRIRQLGGKAGLACPVIGQNDLIINRGGGAVDGLISTRHFYDDGQDKNYNRFKKLMNERFEARQSYVASFGFSAANVIVEALKTTGDYSPVALKKTILKIRNFKSPVGDFYLDEYGDPERPIIVLKIQAGGFVKAHN